MLFSVREKVEQNSLSISSATAGNIVDWVVVDGLWDAFVCEITLCSFCQYYFTAILRKIRHIKMIEEIAMHPQ